MRITFAARDKLKVMGLITNYTMTSDSMTAPEVEDASPWSEWSGCQFGKSAKRIKARSRDCYTEPCEDVQFLKCDE